MDRIESMLLNLISQSKEFLIEKSRESLDSGQRNIKEIELKKDGD